MLMCAICARSCAHMWFNVKMVPFQRFQGLPSEDKDLLLCSRKCRRYVPVSYWGCDSHAVNSHKPRSAGCCFVCDWSNRETRTHKHTHTSTKCIICFCESWLLFSPTGGWVASVWRWQATPSRRKFARTKVRLVTDSPHGAAKDSSSVAGQQLYKSVDIKHWHITLLLLDWGVMRIYMNTWIIILPSLHLTKFSFAITGSQQ